MHPARPPRCRGLSGRRPCPLRVSGGRGLRPAEVLQRPRTPAAGSSLLSGSASRTACRSRNRRSVCTELKQEYLEEKEPMHNLHLFLPKRRRLWNCHCSNCPRCRLSLRLDVHSCRRCQAGPGQGVVGAGHLAVTTRAAHPTLSHGSEAQLRTWAVAWRQLCRASQFHAVLRSTRTRKLNLCSSRSVSETPSDQTPALRVRGGIQAQPGRAC